MNLRVELLLTEPCSSFSIGFCLDNTWRRAVSERLLRSLIRLHPTLAISMPPESPPRSEKPLSSTDKACRCHWRRLEGCNSSGLALSEVLAWISELLRPPQRCFVGLWYENRGEVIVAWLVRWAPFELADRWPLARRVAKLGTDPLRETRRSLGDLGGVADIWGRAELCKTNYLNMILKKRVEFNTKYITYK